MHLLRSMFFVAAKFNFWFKAVHVPGSLNYAANAISRNKLTDLFVHAPLLNTAPCFLSQEVLSVLLSPHDWNSQTWAKQFSTYLTTQ